MYRYLLAALAFCLSAVFARAADELEAREYKDAKGNVLPYRLHRPAVEKDKKYPLVLILHGAGERGSDNSKQLVWFWDAKKSSPLTDKAFLDAKAFAVVPQCPDDKQWVDVPWTKGSYKQPEISEPLRLALELTESLVKELPIDPDRVYVMGMSMGGFGAVDAVMRKPDLFAACMPICGAGDPSKAESIKHVAVWAFHGDKDNAVPVSGSRDLIDALKKAGAKPHYSEYAGVGHNSWSPAFAEKDFWTWLFEQQRKR